MFVYFLYVLLKPSSENVICLVLLVSLTATMTILFVFLLYAASVFLSQCIKVSPGLMYLEN